MVTPVGFSSIKPLGQNWQQVDLGPISLAPQGGANNPAASSMDEFVYGKPEKKHTLFKALAGLTLGGAGLYLGAKKWGVNIAKDATGIKNTVRQASEFIVKHTENAWNVLKKPFAGKNAEAVKETAENTAKNGADKA